MKKKLFLLCAAALLCFSNTAWAVPFPEKTQEVVQDKEDYLPKEQRDQMAEFVKQYPFQYKIVVVESVQPEAQTPDEYARLLYDNYNLSEDTLMIVLDINTQQLGVHPGPALEQQGAKLEMLHEKIVSYYEPFRNQKEYLKGIELFITEVNAELARMGTAGEQAAPVAAAPAPAAAEETAEAKPLWLTLPWWLYLIGILFLGLSGLLMYSFFRRRQVFAAVDDVEEWKDQLLEKIQTIEVDKVLRRSSGMTEERYIELANRKENLLRIRIPDVEMMILEAEEACDRFRFRMGFGLLDEAREMLAEIEAELHELLGELKKVVLTKNESKIVLPEIGKLLESVERKLTNARLDYGLSFHELKVQLDEVEALRKSMIAAQGNGDDVRAYEASQQAQSRLTALSVALDQIPTLVQTVMKDMPEELKELEEGITAAIGDGYDLQMTQLDNSLLQARQLLTAAKTALEEGSIALAQTHVKAFEVQLDATYRTIEQTVIQQREAAAALAAEQHMVEEEVASRGVAEELDLEHREALPEPDASAVWSPEPAITEAEQEAQEAVHSALADEAHLAATADTTAKQDEESNKSDERDSRKQEQPETGVHALTWEERAVLHAPVPKESLADVEERHEPEDDSALTADSPEEEVEYELVIPRQERQELPLITEPEPLVIATEDDALDELERISGILIRLRQEIKRSYLPGIPDQLRYHFDQSVQLLSRIKETMEHYRYELEEVAYLLQEAGDFVAETEKLTERMIAECQRAEGAIQYTNRYRRQNRQVNELLTKAEQSFRQLAFQEAFQLAEEARLLIEGETEEPESRWLLRRKRKG